MADTLSARIRRRARTEALQLRKRGYRVVHPFPRTGRKAIVLIVGCQRSGTTMMLELFTDDRRSVTFGEESSLSLPAEGRLRLKPLPEVKRTLERIRTPLVVLKPLVESQNVPRLLDGLDNSFGVWMYRRAESVAASDLARFGVESGERNLRLLLSNDPPNWRGEYVPDTTRSVISQHYKPGMNPHDAAALFWWARTSLYFDLGLEARTDVHLCSYERLVADPEPTMRSLYDFIGVAYPDRHITSQVHSEAARRGQDIVLSPDVQQLCDELLARLDSTSTGAEASAADRG